ncbi:F-box associated domain type 3 [Arabidopsis suecica]|uniref:F-box associated domain type 3 n=1 Tax=Arabidopsis suecica TaxID=45249 RepID=A0A8T2HHN4_ARASU|nr:F-box associated domain type 3 [Arabidopsis suecica]
MNHQKSTTSGDDETDYFDAIHVDLFTAKILSKLPVKSIAQCRCVSKLWSSQIRRPYYNMLFPIMSPAPPRILFTIENAEGLFFYTSPQPRNPDENTSLVATLHHRTSGNSLRITSPPVGGLLCLEHDRKNYSRVLVISNPITGEFLALPKLRINEIKKELLYLNETYIFGYDPIDKQSKVLRITSSSCRLPKFGQYHVLTFESGNKNLLWRKTECCTLHFPMGDIRAMCISGILYYAADVSTNFTIACFHVRSEDFTFIDINQDIKKMGQTLNFIDFKGKLGAFCYKKFSKTFELWVLEDAERHQWSKHIYQLPNRYLNKVVAAGVVGSSEIVFYRKYTREQDQFFIAYYNLESNIITRVILEVPLLFSGTCCVNAFTNYVGDVRLM